jgi:DNA-directed RNA polymerase subunit M/transcription elongation factor TFIIS
MNKLICKCGNDMFHVGTNDELTMLHVMCSKCKTVYDDKGREVNTEHPLETMAKCPKCGCTVIVFDPKREGWSACERCGYEENILVGGKEE